MTVPQVRFWGVRGSFPAALASCRTLGGNTACIEVEWQGQHLIFDAGTGIRKLGESFLAHPPRSPLNLLFTHAHWDHIQGFPFFAPAYSPQFQLHIHSLQRKNKFKHLLHDQQQVFFSQKSFEQIRCELSFHEWEEGQTFQLGPFEIETWILNHPGICSGYRVRMGSYVLAYISDVAPSTDYLLADTLPERPTREQALKRLYENQLHLADQAHTVIYDTFFTPEQYQKFSHWGHSTLEHALEICQRCQVQNLIMFHHNAEISDAQQFQRLQQTMLRPTNLKVLLAQEGKTISCD